MNFLPRINFLSFMLPLSPPPRFWERLQKAVSKFIWNCKRPRLKFSTLLRRREAGELSLPDFKLYYWAFVIGPLNVWFDRSADVAWLPLDKSLVAPLNLEEVLFANIPQKKCLSELGPIILHAFTIWRRVEKINGIESNWTPYSSIFYNECILINRYTMKRAHCKHWWDRGIRTLGKLFSNNGLLSFQSLYIHLKLQCSTFFFYLQLRGPMAGPSWKSPIARFV